MGTHITGIGPARIGLLVEGAYLIVADYYDRPLSQIHACLCTYWGDEGAN